MNKYFNLFKAIVKNNLLREMEFRANFLSRFLVIILWALLQIFTVQVLFSSTREVLGWSKLEIFYLMGLIRIIRAFFDYFFYANMLGLPDLITSGDLDGYLTKPINSLFLVSIRRQQFNEWPNFLIGLGFVLYSWMQMGMGVGPWQILSLITGIILGLVAFYAIFLFSASLSFYFTRLDSLNAIYDVLNTALRFPLDIFTKNLVVQDIVLLPFIVIATLPSKIFLGKVPVTAIISEFTVCLTLLLFAVWFWSRALRIYSSASS